MSTRKKVDGIAVLVESLALHGKTEALRRQGKPRSGQWLTGITAFVRQGKAADADAIHAG